MKLIGTGSYTPKKIITNDYLSGMVDTNDEWISTRTGIKARHISEGETNTDLGVNAALDAIKNADIDVSEIDLILVATMTPDSILPNTASQIQSKLGAVNATCFDINAACTGFLFALNTANAYLSSGMYDTALVIGTETLSRIVDWTDRSTCVLFGDGAGAVIVKADPSRAYFSVTGSDGAKGHVLTGGKTKMNNFLINIEETHSNLVTNDNTSSEINSGIMKNDYFMWMDGQEVFKFAVTKVPECIKLLLDKSGKTVDDIECYVLHQANIRIISSVAKRLNVSEDKIPVNLHNYGNTSAASIPLLLDELNKNGKLRSGAGIVLSGFGGGLTWGASYMEI